MNAKTNFFRGKGNFVRGNPIKELNNSKIGQSSQDCPLLERSRRLSVSLLKTRWIVGLI